MRTWALSWCSEVATKTNDAAGDGTTTATVLAQALVTRGHEERGRGRQPHGHQAAACRRLLTPLWSALNANSQKVSRPARHRACRPPFLPATTTIGKLIAEAMEKVAADGVITIEESKTS